MASRTLAVKIIGDSSSLKNAFSDAEKGTKGFSGKLGGLKKIAGIVGGVAGIGAVAAGLKSTINAAKDAEASQARVKKMLENVGISWEKHGGHIDKTIAKHAMLTGFDDEDLAESFANMVRTTGNVNEALELNALTADLARTKGMDLAKAQSLLARVYNGSFTGLKRLGIAIEPVTTAQDALKRKTDDATDAQKRAAKQADDLATRQKAIAKLQEQFGGQAEAYGKTAAGAQDRFRVALENLQEKIGSHVLPALTVFLNKMVELVTWTEENWPKIKKTVEDVFNKLRPIIEPTLNVIKGVIQTITALIQGDWDKFWDGIKTIVVNALTALKNLISLQFDIFKTIASKLGEKIKDGIVDGVTGLAGAVWNVVNNIGSFFQERAEAAAGWGLGLGSRVKNAIVNGVTGVAGAVWDVVNNIGSFFAEKVGAVLEWGASLGRRIKSGIVNALGGIGGGIWDALQPVRSAIGTVIAWVHRALRLINDLIDRAEDVKGVLDKVIKGPSGIDLVKKIPGFQHGVQNFRGGLALVGEGGPELVNLPRGADVIPLSRGGSAAAVAPINIYVAGSVITERDLADTVRRELLRMKGRAVNLGLS